MKLFNQGKLSRKSYCKYIAFYFEILTEIYSIGRETPLFLLACYLTTAKALILEMFLMYKQLYPYL